MEIEAYSYSDYASDKGDRKLTSGYCTYVGGNIVTWRSKKQNVVSRSSAEVEYRAMVQTACELMWPRSLLVELGFTVKTLMPMHCTNQAVIFITNNLFTMKEQNILKLIVTT